MYAIALKDPLCEVDAKDLGLGLVELAVYLASKDLLLASEMSYNQNKKNQVLRATFVLG